ncbi:phytanoyl-CoA dioxygenase family protein [Gordonia sp. OPL2]|uniref:phytanoyl-CoA dioxygenase family protein n=1 Tax=Gordonia sp. OPL2 TaxID=2486274 RepID=UPI0016567F32|nr:phytanoyl-CoA dioxygenase family protein [Gordonia sp. OPL2]ROZ88026.1 phytanoyl-CoA dioxygenase [Gordonia sp. OPL2]
MITRRIESGRAAPTSPLVRNITDDERAVFDRDGAVRLRAVIPLEWVEFLRAAVTRLMDRADSTSQNYTASGQPRFFSQAYPRFVDDAFDIWALQGPTRQIAEQMDPDNTSLRFFYDQVFVQEPGASKGAPFHQDHAYLPIDGTLHFRIWVPLDVVTPDSGAVRYLKGSHRGPIYRPTSFSGDRYVSEVYETSPYPILPDHLPDDPCAWLIGEAEPGDALLHHPRTVHGSPPNTSSHNRRAVTSIFIGDDVVWDPRPGTSFDHIGRIGDFDPPRMVAGELVADDLFPVVWTREAGLYPPPN